MIVFNINIHTYIRTFKHDKYGYVGQSVNPPVHQHYVQGARQNRAGGGAELECTYHILLMEDHFCEAMNVFEQYVPRQDVDRFSS